MIKYDFILKKVTKMKKILILSKDNTPCITIAEGLINKYLHGIKAYSATLNPRIHIALNTKKVLDLFSAWSKLNYPKKLDTLKDIEFDLVVTVCESTDEMLLPFPKKTKIIYIPVQEPKDNDFDSFVSTLREIKGKLLPIVRKKLS